jgi:hypothetical protein
VGAGGGGSLDDGDVGQFDDWEREEQKETCEGVAAYAAADDEDV